ncbi:MULTISPECIES: DUF3574 domain-containing protein [unclassified Caballeronia]|uniref:DUF3574 domain-containing protein n=1 Tax=unclassified Caballeronia TaxID=2646786 RepID=UPI00285D5200|nr:MULTISPECIES: DUF3574 domain-containing protein [unclassified Caballeronia]MDR5752774.1 DUF3574 domain-containing protein [Caballeronia sp. LZ024]MDR5841416.1 DUF3574 domain-containing protein [Caballeronia sp. LZ031]
MAVLAFGCIAAGCAAVHETGCAQGEQRSVSDMLYFGTSRAAGTITSAQWSGFLRSAVTPRFPEGLTAWPASGQWRTAGGAVVHEASFVLILVHPDDDTSETAVRAIIGEYKSRFDQEAVMRVKSHACVSF